MTNRSVHEDRELRRIVGEPLYRHELEPVLAAEERIVWLEHPEAIGHYVRERVEWLDYPSAHPRWRRWRSWRPGQSERLVAYAVLRRGTPRMLGSFRRRIWFVTSADPYSKGGAPCEAVDPLRVRAGQLTPRPR